MIRRMREEKRRRYADDDRVIARIVVKRNVRGQLAIGAVEA